MYVCIYDIDQCICIYIYMFMRMLKMMMMMMMVIGVCVCSCKQKVVEHFHRNQSKLASDDVAKRVFLLDLNQIELTYHLEDDGFIAATRSIDIPNLRTLTKMDLARDTAQLQMERERETGVARCSRVQNTGGGA